MHQQLNSGVVVMKVFYVAPKRNLSLIGMMLENHIQKVMLKILLEKLEKQQRVVLVMVKQKRFIKHMKMGHYQEMLLRFQP